MKIVDLQEARKKGKTHLLELIQKLAFEDAKQLVHQIHKAAENLHPHNIIILMHVPPFKENARHQGKLCEPTHLPLFLSKVTGDMIRRCASKYPHIDFQVLCGHTHSLSFYKPLSNMTVKAGSSVLGKHPIQDIMFIDSSTARQTLTSEHSNHRETQKGR